MDEVKLEEEHQKLGDEEMVNLGKNSEVMEVLLHKDENGNSVENNKV